jgi:puromycin-sensitive aminopeptidase
MDQGRDVSGLHTPFGERHQGRGTPPRQARFTLVDDDDDEKMDLVTTPYSHRSEAYRTPGPGNGAMSQGKSRDMASFNIDIDDTGDDVLLDWEQYAGRGMNRWNLRIFGRDCSVSPPDWWFHLTKGQRRSVLACSLCVVTATALLLLVMVLASLGLTFFGSSISSPHVEEACAWGEWKLPQWVRPNAYDLNFQVQMEEPWMVGGTVVIDLDVQHQTRCIVLHAQNMTVEDVRITGGAEDADYVKNNGVLVQDIRFNQSLEQVTLEWQDSISQGKKTLYMEFSYPLRDGMSGFYRSTYLDGDVEESLAATQFEANSARSAFPCFDEPEYKATFAVEVITSKEYQVLSNMPTRVVHHHDTQSDDIKTWHFQTSPPMSTYLLAVVIGKLKSVQREIELPSEGVWKSNEYYIQPEGNKRIVQVWGIPSQVATLEFAADAAAAIVPFYEDTLQVAYALPKLDLVAIPDFSAGAMENWGLITYRQIALSVSPTSSLQDKRYVTIIIAHELAHQWFGNLVTMSWWNDLWLNEGFASYFEYLGATAVHPEMSFLDDFYIDNLPLAFDFDGKQNSHALSMGEGAVTNSSAIEGVFDAIEYQKGASVLRMLRAWMNRESDTWETDTSASSNDMFLKGIHEYLIAHSYRNSSARALWESVEGPSDVDLMPLMHEWTFMDGFPLVTVVVDGKGSVTLKQQKFSDSTEIPCQTENLWWIPTAYISSESATQVKWGELNSCQSLRPLTTISKNGWIKVNALQYGYYRVNYSPQLWGQLHNAAQQYDANGFPVLSGADLAGLLEDSFHVAGHGEVTMAVFLTFIETLGLRPVDDAGPWLTALPYMKKIDHLVSCQKEWSRYVQSHILTPFIENGTLSGNSKTKLADFFTFSSNMQIDDARKPLEMQMLRPAILDAAGYYGISDVGKEAEQIFKKIVSSKSVSLDSDLRSAMYNTVAKTNNKKYMQDMLRLLESAANADESERIIRALSIFDQGNDVLDLSLKPLIRPQDVGILLESYAVNQGNVAAVHLLEWLQENMNELYTKLGSDTGAARKIARVLERISAHISEEKAFDMYKTISNDFSNIFVDQMPINRAIEAIQSNSHWVKTHGDFLCDWIKTS